MKTPFSSVCCVNVSLQKFETVKDQMTADIGRRNQRRKGAQSRTKSAWLIWKEQLCHWSDFRCRMSHVLERTMTKALNMQSLYFNFCSFYFLKTTSTLDLLSQQSKRIEQIKSHLPKQCSLVPQNLLSGNWSKFFTGETTCSVPQVSQGVRGGSGKCDRIAFSTADV